MNAPAIWQGNTEAPDFSPGKDHAAAQSAAEKISEGVLIPGTNTSGTGENGGKQQVRHHGIVPARAVAVARGQKRKKKKFIQKAFAQIWVRHSFFGHDKIFGGSDRIADQYAGFKAANSENDHA